MSTRSDRTPPSTDIASGGPETDLIRVVESPLDPAALDRLVSDPRNGGRALFVGAVRDSNRGSKVTRVHYEAYVPMAALTLARIADEAGRRYEVSAVAVHHRIGALEVGDVAVVIAVGAPHRGPAFDACRYVIEQVKRRAPIWKKESYEDGEAWVSPTP